MNHSDLSLYSHKELGSYTHEQLAYGLLGLNLITDRSLFDVERWRELRTKGWLGMTEFERLEWLGEIETTPAATKGMYTHNDLNRVESAVESILNRFKQAGYKTPDLSIKTDWTYQDVVHRDDMIRYFDNISKIRELLPVLADTPAAPTVAKRLNYEIANDIEKILEDVNNIFTKLTNTWYYTGEIISGEV